ncbi:MAG: hypothetical protein LAO05_02760 [Acidobacteriia bacterium]|nr:hypothetical protein [Terriglobia bacterium]
MWKARRNVTGDERHRPLDDSTFRVLLDAAAARPDELPDVPPFFVARVKAAAGKRRDQGAFQLVAAVAWHVLPALVAVVVALTLWVGLEIGRDAATQEDAAMVVLQSRDAGADAPLTALLLSGNGEALGSGGVR